MYWDTKLTLLKLRSVRRTHSITKIIFPIQYLNISSHHLAPHKILTLCSDRKGFRHFAIWILKWVGWNWLEFLALSLEGTFWFLVWAFFIWICIYISIIICICICICVCICVCICLIISRSPFHLALNFVIALIHILPRHCTALCRSCNEKSELGIFNF